MEKLLHIGALFFFTFSLNAQKDTSSCHTIILLNGREIPATIDSTGSGFLFYHQCPDTFDHQFTISLRAVFSVQPPLGKTDSLSQQAANSKDGTRRWMFKHKTKKRIRSVSEGQAINVVYRNDNNRKRVAKGKWKNLTDDALVLFSPKGETRSILKKRITKVILIPHVQVKKNWAYFALGRLIVALGLSIALVIPVAAVLYGAKHISLYFIVGGLLGILVIAAGMSKLNPNRSKSLKSPFNDTWEIVEPPAEINVEEYPGRP